MELVYKIPVVRGLHDMLSRQEIKPYLEWYLAGLRDAGAISSYEFRPAGDNAFSIKIYELLTMEIPDNAKRENIDAIDATLRRSYSAEDIPTKAA